MTLWLIGGLDPSGGAGLIRDVWAANRVSPDVEVHCVVTALTRQGDGRPARTYPVSTGRLRACLGKLPPPAGVKLGLVPASLAPALHGWLSDLRVPVVLDPVLTATDGGSLGASLDGIRELSAVSTLITPNPEEAAALIGELGSCSHHGLRERLVVSAVLLKSVPGGDVRRVGDVLIETDGDTVFDRLRVGGPDPRGNGCALATAIACRLVVGEPMRDAVAWALEWLDRARTSIRRGPDGRAHLS